MKPDKRVEEYHMPSIEVDGHHWIRVVDHLALLTQHHQDMMKEVAEILDRHCEWKPTYGYDSEEEKGFQNGLQTEAKLIRDEIIISLGGLQSHDKTKA